MDQPEEPMELDSSVSYIEMDNSKLDDTTDSKIFVNDSNDSKVDEPDSVSENTRHENKNSVTLTTGIEIFSREEKVRMEERAKRFGLGEQNNKNVIEEEAPEIYADLGIVEEDDALKNLRLNVLHMRGTEEMSTKDVFKYFEDFSPASIEWINDISCNVVWLDNVTAAKALLKMSKKIEGLGEKVKADKNSTSETSNFDDANDTANEDCVVEVIGDEPMDEAGDKKNESTINIRDIKCPLPPGLWRKGVECPKSKCILLRFATRADKKQPNAEKLSDYYKKHGNPNFGGIRGILTASRKRLIKDSKHGRKRIKPDELAGVGGDQGSKNPWGTLSQSWGVNDFTEEEFINKNLSKDQGTSIKERLGFKPSSKEVSLHSEESGSSSEAGSEDEWCKRSKVMRMRMHADDEEAKVQKRRQQIRHQVATIRSSRTDDLRSRLGSSRRPPAIFRHVIQVVVTNNQMVLPDSPDNNRSEEEDEEEQEEEEQEEEEQEEGEIIDEIEVPIKQEKIDSWEHEEEEEEEDDDEDDDDDDDDDEDEEEEEDSDESEKEVQGPRGSVIKVVQKHKPRVASTVWARLNTKPEESEAVKQRRSTKGDLRETLRGDLRSRLGKQSKARSPLRIEVKNDKYANNESDSE